MLLKFICKRQNTNGYTGPWLTDIREVIILLILLDLTVWVAVGFTVYCLFSISSCT